MRKVLGVIGLIIAAALVIFPGLCWFAFIGETWRDPMGLALVTAISGVPIALGLALGWAAWGAVQPIARFTRRGAASDWRGGPGRG